MINTARGVQINSEMTTSFLDALQTPELARVCCAILNPRPEHPSQGTGIRILRRVDKQAYEIMKKQIKLYTLRLVGEAQTSFSTTELVLNGVSLSELTMRINLTEGK